VAVGNERQEKVEPEFVPAQGVQNPALRNRCSIKAKLPSIFRCRVGRMDAWFPGARPFSSPLAPVVGIALPPASLRLTLVGLVIMVGGHFGLLHRRFRSRWQAAWPQ